ncbi:MAG: lipoate--protein ligase family protein [Gemmatimonadaceae bacterium]
MHWRFLHTPPLSGAANMAIDDALLARARTAHEGVVRVYSWLTATLSLGRNQTARGAWDPERAAAHGIGIVRRLTGGRAVLHHREITYSVTAPASDDRDLQTDYAAISQLLLAALRGMGVAAEIAYPTTRMPRPGSAPCFELPAAGELVVGGEKLVGSAQVREGGAFLQHGSILVHDDQHRLCDVATGPVPVTPAASLSRVLRRDVDPVEFADRLRSCVRASWDAHVEDLPPESIDVAAASSIARYESHAWTWRR